MPDKKISQLNSATTLTGVEQVPVVQSGSTVKTTVQDVANYTPVGKGYVLLATSIPFVFVSSGTMGNNGALSGITAVSAIYPAAYVYLEANVIAAGVAAGWYYAVFSSTTAATVYNNVYTSGVPAIPASPTPFVTTGPGAYTRTVTVIGGYSITLPANTLGDNGYLDVKQAYTQTNNANNKNGYVRMNGTVVLSVGLFSTASMNLTGLVANAGIKTKQYASTVCSVANYSLATALRSIDTTTSQTVDISFQAATATDTVVLNSTVIVVYK